MGSYLVVSVVPVKAKQVWQLLGSWGLRLGSHHSSYSGEILYSAKILLWWVLMTIFRNFCPSMSIHTDYQIQRDWRSREFLKHAGQSSISPLTAVGVFLLTLASAGEGLKAHFCCQNSQSRSSLQQKTAFMSWNAIHIIFLLKFPHTCKALLLGLHTVVLSWPSWISSCPFSSKTHDHPHCWHLYAKLFWWECFTRHLMYTQRTVTSRHLTLIHFS